MLELLEEPNRARAAVFMEMFPSPIADRSFRWQSWIYLLTFAIGDDGPGFSPFDWFRFLKG